MSTVLSATKQSKNAPCLNICRRFTLPASASFRISVDDTDVSMMSSAVKCTLDADGCKDAGIGIAVLLCPRGSINHRMRVIKAERGL